MGNAIPFVPVNESREIIEYLLWLNDNCRVLASASHIEVRVQAVMTKIGGLEYMTLTPFEPLPGAIWIANFGERAGNLKYRMYQDLGICILTKKDDTVPVLEYVIRDAPIKE